MQTARSNYTSIVLGLALTLLTCASAQAGVLATWGTPDVLGTAAQNSVSFEAAGITGGDLTSIYGPSSGYVPGYEWGIWGSGAAANEEFELTMSTATGLTVDTFNFSMFNNDCQTGSGYQTWCSTATWAIRAKVNSNPFSADLLTFNAGPPSIHPSFSVALGIALNAGDTLTMQIRGINAGSAWPGSGQYYIDDISLTSVPEPTSFALLSLALLGFGIKRRGKA